MASSLCPYVRDQSFRDPVLEFISRRPVTAINISSNFFFFLVILKITDVKNFFYLPDIGGPDNVFIFSRPQDVSMFSFEVQSMLNEGNWRASNGNEWHAFMRMVTEITSG